MEIPLPATFPQALQQYELFQGTLFCLPSFTAAVAETYSQRVCKLDTFAATKFPLPESIRSRCRTLIASSLGTTFPASNLGTRRAEETFIVKSGKKSARFNMKTFWSYKFASASVLIPRNPFHLCIISAFHAEIRIFNSLSHSQTSNSQLTGNACLGRKMGWGLCRAPRSRECWKASHNLR